MLAISQKSLTLKVLSSLVVFFSLLMTIAASANAQAEPWHRGHEMGRFHYDLHTWRGGHWYHGIYGGRLGWYWMIGDSYYFYERPIYPYPDPGALVIEQAPPVMAAPPVPVTPSIQPQNTSSVWYFCEAKNAYYPYVSDCPSGWKTVPASPPPATR